MRNLIILILISLSLFAEDNQNFKKPSKEALEAYQRKIKAEINKDNPYMWDFQEELRKVWGKVSKNITKKEILIEINFSKEQAEIDIAKAEMQKLFLEYIKQGKFKENTNFKIAVKKANLEDNEINQ